MDLLDVMMPFWTFLARFFSVSITIGGYTFTVGAFFLWCALVIVLIGFLKGLAD